MQDELIKLPNSKVRENSITNLAIAEIVRFWFMGKYRSHLIFNLVFIILFLNVWDFVISRDFINAMVIGFLMFGPTAFLWIVGTVRAAALITLISLFEFFVMVVFIGQGFELEGLASWLKSIFWLPYLIMAGTNGFWGLNIYSKYKEAKQARESRVS